LSAEIDQFPLEYFVYTCLVEGFPSDGWAKVALLLGVGDMTTENDAIQTDEDQKNLSDRRDFLKKAGKVAATAPAVTLLFSASLKPTEAEAKMYTYDPGPWIP
jgi:hypothetical protein